MVSWIDLATKHIIHLWFAFAFVATWLAVLTAAFIIHCGRRRSNNSSTGPEARQ
jgi:thiosulfate reductase cytochrome b subunit